MCRPLSALYTYSLSLSNHLPTTIRRSFQILQTVQRRRRKRRHSTASSPPDLRRGGGSGLLFTDERKPKKSPPPLFPKKHKLLASSPLLLLPPEEVTQEGAEIWYSPPPLPSLFYREGREGRVAKNGAMQIESPPDKGNKKEGGGGQGSKECHRLYRE